MHNFILLPPIATFAMPSHRRGETIVSDPLLHGGSGLTDDDFKNAIKGGIAKVNIFTDLNVAAEKAAAEMYSEGLGYSKVMPHVVDAVFEAAKRKMIIFGSGRTGTY